MWEKFISSVSRFVISKLFGAYVICLVTEKSGTSIFSSKWFSISTFITFRPRKYINTTYLSETLVIPAIKYSALELELPPLSVSHVDPLTCLCSPCSCRPSLRNLLTETERRVCWCHPQLIAGYCDNGLCPPRCCRLRYSWLYLNSSLNGRNTGNKWQWPIPQGPQYTETRE